jgi:hypothetical protein
LASAENCRRQKATFEYGLMQDPEYSMFFYNLACTYGEMDKMNEALTQLRQAYKCKVNSIPGESVPDPLKDDSSGTTLTEKSSLTRFTRCRSNSSQVLSRQKLASRASSFAHSL